MAISTSILILILVLFVATSNAYIPTPAGTHRKAASKLSSIDEEAHAVRSSKWWSNQNNISNRCSWPGIECNEAGSITKISSPRNSSPIPLCICHTNIWQFLPNLVHLDLSKMEVTGAFPEELSGPKKLTHLTLSHSSLQGVLPFTLANLTQLVMFDISYNYIGVQILHEFSMLELVTLDLSANLFSGICKSHPVKES